MVKTANDSRGIARLRRIPKLELEIERLQENVTGAKDERQKRRHERRLAVAKTRLGKEQKRAERRANMFKRKGTKGDAEGPKVAAKPKGGANKKGAKKKTTDKKEPPTEKPPAS